MEDDPDPSDERSGPSDDDQVGYGKPPKHSQWKPGFCPNPRGRPRKAKGRKAIVERIANEICLISIGGKSQEVTRIELVLFSIRNATANGYPGALKMYDRLLNEVSDDDSQVPQGTLIAGEELSDDEWSAKYGYLGGSAPKPTPKLIQMADVKHLLKGSPD